MRTEERGQALREVDEQEENRVDGREERGEKTGQQLLEAARRLWAARGFAGASVRDIAQEAGVNPALVRYHFGSKEGLYHAALTKGLEQLQEALFASFGQGDTVRERLRGVVRAYLEYLAKSQDITRLIQRAVLDGDTQVLGIVKGYLSPMWELLAMSLASKDTPIGRIEDVIMSVFGAIVIPTLYGPLVEAVWGEDPMSEAMQERRRWHLERLLDGLLLVLGMLD